MGIYSASISSSFQYYLYNFFFFSIGLQERAEYSSSLLYLAVVFAAAHPGVVLARGCDTLSSSFDAEATTSARGTAAPSSPRVPSMNLRTASPGSSLCRAKNFYDFTDICQKFHSNGFQSTVGRTTGF